MSFTERNQKGRAGFLEENAKAETRPVLLRSFRLFEVPFSENSAHLCQEPGQREEFPCSLRLGLQLLI